MKIDIGKDFKIYLLQCIRDGFIDTESPFMTRFKSETLTIEHVYARDELLRLEAVRSQFKDIPAKCDECQWKRTFMKDYKNEKKI